MQCDAFRKAVLNRRASRIVLQNLEWQQGCSSNTVNDHGIVMPHSQNDMVFSKGC